MAAANPDRVESDLIHRSLVNHNHPGSGGLLSFYSVFLGSRHSTEGPWVGPAAACQLGDRFSKTRGSYLHVVISWHVLLLSFLLFCPHRHARKGLKIEIITKTIHILIK